MNRKQKEFRESNITYAISWVCNILYAFFFSSSWVFSFQFYASRDNIIYIGDYYIFLIYFISIYLCLILINTVILIIFHLIKVTYNKLKYWFGTLLFALLPYIWFILCCIDHYMRYNTFI